MDYPGTSIRKRESREISRLFSMRTVIKNGSPKRNPLESHLLNATSVAPEMRFAPT